MTWVRALQAFNVSIDGRTVEMKPGKLVEMPHAQAEDFRRAGLVSISAQPVDRSKRKLQTAYPSDSDRQGVFAVIVNYNMPERTQALADYITSNCKGVDVVVVDNGSDEQPQADYTTLKLARNVQTTNGWLMGLHYVDALCRMRGVKPFAYWFLITSAEFVGGDPLQPMVDLLRRNPRAVGVHPALTDDSTTAWTHMIERGGVGARKVWMIDNIASLYRASWFDEIGRFDPALTFAWGIDLETGYLARSQGRSLYIHEAGRVKKVTDIGYTMNRMGMTAQQRRERAGGQMADVLSKKYGPEWNNVLREDYPVPDNDLVSVIVPTHNRPELLDRALASIAAQTYPNLEAVVVNDGGCDVSAIVGKYGFARLIDHATNKGLPAARNTAVKASRGAYLAYLDDDDWYYPNHLETLVDAIAGNHAVYSDADGVFPNETRLYTSNDYSRDAIHQHSLWPVNTVLHERSLFDAAGGFDETLKNHEDWDLWLRISQHADWVHVPETTCAIDRTRETMGSDRQAMQAGFELVRARYAK